MAEPLNLPLQLALWEWLEEAAQVVDQLPELVMIEDGVEIIDAALKDLATVPLAMQLAVAAQAIDQLSTLYQRKADEFFSSWEQDLPASGATLSPSWTSGLVRQPVGFDLSSVLEPVATPEQPPRKKRPQPDPDDSIAAPITKEAAIALLEAMAEGETLQSQLAALAGNESPAQWQKAIDQHLREPMTFTQLQRQTGLAPVELWLGLLLSGYGLSQPLPASNRASAWAIAFYTAEIVVLPATGDA